MDSAARDTPARYTPRGRLHHVDLAREYSVCRHLRAATLGKAAKGQYPVCEALFRRFHQPSWMAASGCDWALASSWKQRRLAVERDEQRRPRTTNQRPVPGGAANGGAGNARWKRSDAPGATRGAVEPGPYSYEYEYRQTVAGAARWSGPAGATLRYFSGGSKHQTLNHDRPPGSVILHRSPSDPLAIL
ncbi:hypothetical protein TOPH_01013 [Tolypocladium ophioglossoides CBS 100239]|uniref:Uncharacterized protein n=1 Tax=Tolypocladium ophioglossoides (strain CBS 100239) TaxID=1163406 RepID=A0A0L0NJL1_TOLOC|nr:hypothetical protein TOPH_01013 [Tolypocladium ophioglossoides CBS 100239]